MLGGSPYNRCSLYVTLTNPIYIGKIKHKGELFDGEHEPIVPTELFMKVQDQLRRNGRNGQHLRNRYGALLKGLLCCKACQRAMVHTFSRRGSKCWRYYVCCKAIKSGRASCPSGMLPAGEIERLVVDQIRCIGQDPALLGDVLAQARAGIETEIDDLKVERRDLERELARHHGEIRKLAAMGPAGNVVAGRIVDLTERAEKAERRSAGAGAAGGSAKNLKLKKQKMEEVLKAYLKK